MTAATKTIPRARKSDSNAALIAELNAELRERDPQEILRRRVRNATLDELEARVNTDLGALAQASRVRGILRIIDEMRSGVA